MNRRDYRVEQKQSGRGGGSEKSDPSWERKGRAGEEDGGRQATQDKVTEVCYQLYHVSWIIVSTASCLSGQGFFLNSEVAMMKLKGCERALSYVVWTAEEVQMMTQDDVWPP